MSNEFTFEETRNWWLGVVVNQTKLQNWLCKLYRTELEGYTEHMAFMAKAGAIPVRTAKILTNIALDELYHAEIIKGVIEGRGLTIADAPRSAYWDTVTSAVQSLEDYCAVNHFGESLAARRFEWIMKCDFTPADIRIALSQILPDERFHGVTLEKLAGLEALERMEPVHHAGIATLRNKTISHK